MSLREEFVEWDEQKKSLVVTRQETIQIDGTNTEEAKQILEKKLRDIVRQIKTLKAEAQRTKTLLDTLNVSEGPIDPAPVPVPVEETQSPSVETPDSK